MAARPWHILSLCSGIGGLDIGVAAALRGNCRTVCMVERETYAAAVLAARAKEGRICSAPIWSDVTTLDAKPWRGKVDAIIGSYPCQSLSVAGKRLGETDSRWLWPHFARIIKVIEPSWCFFENVANHVNIGLECVWRDLRAMGFKVEAGLFEAAESGACHIRRRLFIYARREELYGPNFIKTRHVADSTGHLCEGRRAQQPQPNNIASANRRRHVADADSQRGRQKQQAAWRWVVDTDWRKWWESSAGICRVASRTSQQVDQLRALGNAVVPACAAYAFQALNRQANSR